MADKLTITVEGTEKIDAALKRLYKLGARKRDISKVFREGTAELRKEFKNQIPVNKRKRTYSKKYGSRVHNAGVLKRSVRFTTSKKFKLAFYVLAHRSKNPNADAWYSHFVSKGTKKGIQANDFADRAWNNVGNSVLNNVKTGLWKLANQIWKGNLSNG